MSAGKGHGGGQRSGRQCTDWSGNTLHTRAVKVARSAGETVFVSTALLSVVALKVFSIFHTKVSRKFKSPKVPNVCKYCKVRIVLHVQPVREWGEDTSVLYYMYSQSENGGRYPEDT